MIERLPARLRDSAEFKTRSACIQQALSHLPMLVLTLLLLTSCDAKPKAAAAAQQPQIDSQSVTYTPSTPE
jgi:hypothetical protein